MGKMNLTSLLQSSNTSEAPPAPEIPESKLRDAQAALPQELASSESRESSELGPRYLQLERKETRLTLDQLNALSLLARGLNKKRRGTGERLTENTLIRIAVDLLLAQSDSIAGTTETELRKSLNL